MRVRIVSENYSVFEITVKSMKEAKKIAISCGLIPAEIFKIDSHKYDARVKKTEREENEKGIE